MKTTATFIALLWGAISLHGVTHTVDNVFPGANFTNLQTAINNASAGDTLLIQPSPVNYGTINVNKKLYLKGPGHRSGWASQFAEINSVNLSAGCDSTTFDGLTFIGSLLMQTTPVRYVSFLNNMFQNFDLNVPTNRTASHFVVQGNIFIRTFHPNNSISCGSTTSHSWLITKNLFMRNTASTTTTNGIIANLHPTSIFEYNTIVSSIHGTGTFNVFENSDNAVIRNNVFFVNGTSYTDLTVGCSNCTFEYNLQFNPIGVLDSLPGTGNLDNVNPQFVNMGSNYNNNSPNQRWDYNGDFDFQSISSANTASSNNGKIGHLGGLGHFHPRGFSAVFPVILHALPQNRIVPQGDPVIIRVEAQRGGL